MALTNLKMNAFRLEFLLRWKIKDRMLFLEVRRDDKHWALYGIWRVAVVGRPTLSTGRPDCFFVIR